MGIPDLLLLLDAIFPTPSRNLERFHFLFFLLFSESHLSNYFWDPCLTPEFDYRSFLVKLTIEISQDSITSSSGIYLSFTMLFFVFSYSCWLWNLTWTCDICYSSSCMLPVFLNDFKIKSLH